MLSRRAVASAARLSRTVRPSRITISSAPFSTARCLRAEAKDDPAIYDPGMNGGYINPPRVSRQFRDPYGDWYDKQERRNFGEPLHEDNDILGLFALEEYRHMTPAMGLVCWGVFISLILGLSYTVKQMYPDRPSAPKEYEDGLDWELGGKGSLRAWKESDEL